MFIKIIILYNIIKMSVYNKHLSEPWFSLIQLGLKTCEGILNKGDFLHL